MKNKFLKKVGGILLASVMMCPLFVNAATTTCSGTARYYFNDEEVFYTFDKDGNQIIGEMGGIKVDQFSATNYPDSPKGITWTAIFPTLPTSRKYDNNQEIKKITGITLEDFKSWANLVADTVYDPNINDVGATKIDNENQNGEMRYYIHGSWSQNGGVKSENNPVYEAGVLRGVKDYDNEHGTKLFDQLVTELYESQLTLNRVSIAGGNDSFNVSRIYDVPFTSVGTKYFDLARWAIFQHYKYDTDSFINPATKCIASGNASDPNCSERFRDGNNGYKAGYAEILDINDSTGELDITNNRPSDAVRDAYIEWYYDDYEPTGANPGGGQQYPTGYSWYVNNCHGKGNNVPTACKLGVEIWTPETTAWISNLVYLDRPYTFDCTVNNGNNANNNGNNNNGGNLQEEEKIKNNKTGIPSYGYLAIILAGAAGVYVIAKKRSKFIKF